jgi:hypothetical protein
VRHHGIALVPLDGVGPDINCSFGIPWMSSSPAQKLSVFFVSGLPIRFLGHLELSESVGSSRESRRKLIVFRPREVD